RAAILEERLERLESALDPLTERLAVGAPGVRLADRLTLQTRVSGLRLELEEERRTAEDARETARGRLGLPPGAPLPAFAAPEISEIVAGDDPGSALAAARRDEAEGSGNLARARANPQTAVGLRFERERGGMESG